MFQQPEKKAPEIYYPQWVANNMMSGNKNFQHLFLPPHAYSHGPNLQIPMQKVYNINLPGPTGGHVEMKNIYEAVLPGKEGRFTATTLGERIQMHDYVRQILIQVNDGEDISLDSTGHRSLMSYIKFMELNPNYYSPIHSNPYNGLPYGLLIYRSCFPIRLDNKSQSIICARDSIGLNIRLYSLTHAELYSFKMRDRNYHFYDVWRELAYYEYVRENIIKTKQSPNFAMLYSFFFSPNKNIDFYKLKKGFLTQKDMLTKEFAKFKNQQPGKPIRKPLTEKRIKKLPDEIYPELQIYSGTTLILITEAPHHNLYQWASRGYEKEGIVNKMISHGFYDEKIWTSILFQIMSALCVLQKHGIYLRNMSIGDNIYIKDLQTRGKASGYWKYIINGLTFYLPNYGFLVMIDSNFKDIEQTSTISVSLKREFKMYASNIIGKRYSLDSMSEKVYLNYRNIVNTNSFTKEHTRNNVTRPPAQIMGLIERIMADDEKDISKIICKHFRGLLNNRIGSYLKKDTEVTNLREITGREPKRGELMAQIIEENVYKWCLVTNVKADGIIDIITKSDIASTDFIDSEVRIEGLKQFPPSEKIEQTSTADINFSTEEALETYIIS